MLENVRIQMVNEKKVECALCNSTIEEFVLFDHEDANIQRFVLCRLCSDDFQKASINLRKYILNLVKFDWQQKRGIDDDDLGVTMDIEWWSLTPEEVLFLDIFTKRNSDANSLSARRLLDQNSK